MKKLFACCLVFVAFEIQAQDANSATDTISQEVFTLIEESASFPGGMAKLYRYLGENQKYPKAARKKKISGRVYVEFVINKDGSIDKESVRTVPEEELKGYGLPPATIITDEECQQEAMRLIKECPNWLPAMQKHKPVKQRFTLPILFKLN